MAEGFARHYTREHGLDVEVQSGGTLPSGRVDPLAIAVMAERGIDISHHTSHRMDLAFAEKADRVLTMGCSAEGACPARILRKVEDWGLEDPVGKDIGLFRSVRDDIDERVRRLLGLPGSAATPPGQTLTRAPPRRDGAP